jgi:hypothetical protein
VRRDLKAERDADRFRHNTPDAEWLQGKREWIAISHDSLIRYKEEPIESQPT